MQSLSNQIAGQIQGCTNGGRPGCKVGAIKRWRDTGIGSLKDCRM